MDTSGSNRTDSNTKVISDTATELAHITQEIYKQNFELSEKNKILSLLHYIDEIILSAVTDTYQIAQRVCDTITEIEDALKAVVIYIKEKEVLRRAGVSQTELVLKLQQELGSELFYEQIPLSDKGNVAILSISENKSRFFQDLRQIIAPQISDEMLAKSSDVEQIRSTLVTPLIVHGEALGLLVVCLSQLENEMPQYQKDLIDQLADIIGIAINNALLYREIQEANDRLKVLDRLKDEFVSVASHELRTPMTAIKSYLWMALTGQGGDLNEKQKYYVQRSYNSVDRLMKLVNDMLNISRIESGRLTVQVAAVDLVKVVREVIEELAPRALELGVTIEQVTVDSLPEVLADGDKIKEVVYNLIGNSLKFTPKGGKVSVSFEQKDSMVEVSVRDTGSGIAAEDLPVLFQKFGILPGTYVANLPASGTGLGLYICKSLVELFEGKIWASSEGKDKGAIFTFSLKVFNQADFERFSQKYPVPEKKPKVALIHQPVG